MTDVPEPSGAVALPASLFLDANSLISAAFPPSPNHAAAVRTLVALAQAVRAGAAALYVSPLVLDEVWWKLGELLYDEAHGGEHAWRRLRWGKRKEALEQHAADMVAATRWLAGGHLVTVTDIGPEDVSVALQHATHAAEPHLAPRDAFHLAVMKRLGIDAIVTNDPDFAQAPGIVAIPYGPT